MTKIYEIPATDLIHKIAQELKNNESIQPPEWAAFVKTGSNKERQPVDEDWWYVRAAAILRKIKILGPIGTAKLRTHFGSKKRRGYRKAVFRQAGGSIIRKILQQLETAGLVQQATKGVHKGRVVTGEGDKLLDKVARK